MQKIFYGGKVLTFVNDEKEEAFLVNDGSIVFVGKNDEVLKMKTDETELVDLKGKTVCPSLFYIAGCLYDEIEDRLKIANMNDFIEKSNKNNENYEIFVNFEHYKRVFLELQEELISLGVLLFQETKLNDRSFSFFKKLAEQQLLKIDIVGYVDILTSKDVMDNNCRSYRKYQNHFRLAGYSLIVDGDVLNRTAWLNKKYNKSTDYFGSANVFDEQLDYVIKTAFEEKRQLILFANGDRALTQVFRCFGSQFKDNIDTMRPLLVGAQMFNKKHLEFAQKFNFSLCVSNQDKEKKLARKNLGLLRVRNFNNFKLDVKSKLSLCFNSKGINDMLNGIKTLRKCLSKNFDLKSFKNLVLTSSYVSFEEMNLGTIENGKKANFICLSSDPTFGDDSKILETYYEGEIT